jgi:phosphoribosylformylglycinamidine cyclo-ligase
MTYAKAGADPQGQREAHKLLAHILESTFVTRRGKVGRPIFPIGHYAGLVDLGDGRVLSLHIDNVGTKVLIAQRMRKYDTIGIDCVAVCANDLICTGAEPISLLDYLAMSRPDRAIVKAIAMGLMNGANEAGLAIVGGETAIVPDLLRESGGLDLVGMAAGICRKEQLILGDQVQEDDTVIGVASSGIHSNGLTLARKILLRKHNLKDKLPGFQRNLGEELLEPTRIYVKPVRELTRRLDVHGLAHITGGSFSKLTRVAGEANLGVNLDQLPPPAKIFQTIQREGHVSDSEMYRTFNMGIGFVVICPESQADRAIRIFDHHGHEAMSIGRVERKQGIRIEGKSVN